VAGSIWKKVDFFSKMTPSWINPPFCNLKKKVLPSKLDISKTLLMQKSFSKSDENCSFESENMTN
jgi:hypothetical protein